MCINEFYRICVLMNSILKICVYVCVLMTSIKYVY